MGNANFVEPLSLAGGIRIKILVLTYIKWFVVLQIAPSLATSIVIENLANLGLACFW